MIDPSFKIKIFGIQKSYHPEERSIKIQLGSFKTFSDSEKELNTNRHLLNRYAKSIDSVYIPYLGLYIEIYCKNKEKTGKVVHPSSKSHPSLTENTKSFYLKIKFVLYLLI